VEAGLERDAGALRAAAVRAVGVDDRLRAQVERPAAVRPELQRVETAAGVLEVALTDQAEVLGTTELPGLAVRLARLPQGREDDVAAGDGSGDLFGQSLGKER
jgi:hypothetical protein